MRGVSRQLLLLASTAAAASCAEPHFRDRAVEVDAGFHAAPLHPVSDGGPLQVLAPEPPAWAEKLLGDYAVRLRIFGHETTSSTEVSHETLSVVQVKFDAQLGLVSFVTQMCRDSATLILGAKAGVKYPELYPPRKLRVDFKDGVFSTSSIGSSAVGYTEGAPSGCSPGLRVRASAAQVWLADGMCDCPSNTDLPKLSTDCRLTDPDADKQPGFTVSLYGTYSSSDYCVTRDDSQFVIGMIDPQGHHTASYAVIQDSWQVECPDGTCTRAHPVVCKPVYNTVAFAPLAPRSDGAIWSCADMLREGAGDLPTDPLVFPDVADCTRDP
ncbi:MAG: hypothetical protein JWN04_4581 [Myxococcaceae bacterium]|nr:hypothetical protein [Myxococcaceae bacterium]